MNEKKNDYISAAVLVTVGLLMCGLTGVIGVCGSWSIDAIAMMAAVGVCAAAVLASAIYLIFARPYSERVAAVLGEHPKPVG